MAEKKKQEVLDIETGKLQANPLQPRGQITKESLKDLVDSIREQGILEPLVIAETPAGYQIIAGERRWRAAKILGLDTVPCIVKKTTPQGMLEMAIVENLQRKDLNPLERARAFSQLMNEFGMANKNIAKKVGKSPSFVSNSLKLLTLPAALKDGLLSGAITEGHARALSSIQDTRLMVEAYKLVLKEDRSVRGAEEIARRMKKLEGNPPGEGDKKGPGKDPIIVDEETDKMERKLFKILGGKGIAKVKITRSRSQTKIRIILKGDTDATQDKLDKIYDGICEKLG